MNKENEPITAGKFFSTHWNLGKPIDEIMVLFAKHHREQQIEAIKEGYILDEFDGIPYALNEKSIENAYPEDRIK